MPINPTYPGVYIQEITGGSPTITGVATSIGAFVDFFPQGPLNVAVQLFSYADFERTFGGLDVRSEASYGIQQFFLNGGNEAYVIRASSTTPANAAVDAAIVVQDGNGNNVLLAAAATPGQWGNNLRVDVDYGTSDPGQLFNLTVTEVNLSGGKPQVIAQESYRNLSLASAQSNFAVQVVNNQSQLITLKLLQTVSPPLPAQTGTTSDGFPGIGFAWGAQSSYPLGAIIVDPNGNLEQASSVQGTSGATQPVWPTAPGATVADGTVTWQVLPAVVARAANTPYSTGALATDSNGNLIKATAAGKSSAAATSAVAWASTIGGTTTDGGVTWTMVATSTAWAASTNYAQGAIIPDGAGWVMAQLVSGTPASVVTGMSGAVHPTWPTVSGGSVADGTLTWQRMATPTARAVSTAYTASAYALDANGNLVQATAGSSSSSLSATLPWATTIGLTTSDGTVTWKLVATTATVWVASTNYPKGAIIYDGANWETVTSLSGPSVPEMPTAWPTSVGGTITDNTITWKLLPTGIGNLPSWAAGTSYGLGDTIVDSNGNLQKVTTAGLSGGTQPTWTLGLGSVVTETGSALTWTLGNAGALAVDLTSKIGVKLASDSALSSSVLDFTTVTAPAAPSWSWLAATFQSLLRKLDPSLANATVAVVGSASTLAYLQFKPGTSSPADYLSFTTSAGTMAANLGITSNSNVNVQQYALGSSQPVNAQALPGSPAAPQLGSDGVWDPVNDSTGVASGLIGDPLLKTGIYALVDVDLFNILCIPATALLPDTDAAQVITDATALCVQERAFYIVEVPQQSANRDTVPAMTTWIDQNATLRSRNAAIYFPRSQLADPLNNFQLRPSGQSGTLAGLYARTDVARGVWKAPAGTEATLAGIQALEYNLIDGENGVLNPLGINCLRNFTIYGIVSWGGRTLYGADQMEDDYKYIPVRRLALFLEESLYRGTQWVVFEPNDEPLWAQIRTSITSFMQDLFKQGAFQGSTPQAAYLVKCDSETTTATDQDQGIVNIVVGFAPLKPAEFVIIQIQQLAGQMSS